LIIMPSLSMQTISPVSFKAETDDDATGDDSSADSSSSEEFFCPCSRSVRSKPNGQPTQDTLDRAMSHYNVMRLQETRTYRATDFLSRRSSVGAAAPNKCSSSSSSSSPIDAACREKMVAWCYQVTDYCTFSRSTVEVAMSLLDRFLSHASPTNTIAQRCRASRKTYQLAAMTALYTSIKIIEPAVFDPAIIASLGRGCVTEDQVVEMERHLLAGVSWDVNHPTAAGLIYSLVDLLPAPTSDATEEETARHAQIKASILTLSLYQTELAVSDYAFVPVRSSTIAVASLINAIHALEALLPADMVTSFLRHIQFVTGLDLCRSPTLDEVMDRLSELVDDHVVDAALASMPPPIASTTTASCAEDSTTCATSSLSTTSSTTCTAEQEGQDDETMSGVDEHTAEISEVQQQQPQQNFSETSSSIYRDSGTCDYLMELNDAPTSSSSAGTFSRRKRRGSSDSLDSMASVDSSGTARSLSPTCIIRGAARQAARYARYLPQ
jgi:hypothetical protein